MAGGESIISWLIGLLSGGVLEWFIGRAHSEKLYERLKLSLSDREIVTLNEEFLLTRVLGDQIRNSGFNPDMIIAIFPGGTTVAEWLARRFLGNYQNPIPVRTLLIETVPKSGGITEAQVRTDEMSIVQGVKPNAKILLVNDISRGGETLKAAYYFVKKAFPQAGIVKATLFCHTDATAKPEYCVVKTNKTIRFEWKG